MQIADILISLLGGFTAGFLNALAGFGSVITLAIYMDIMNIPGHIANGTNRVNILASSTKRCIFQKIYIIVSSSFININNSKK